MTRHSNLGRTCLRAAGALALTLATACAENVAAHNAGPVSPAEQAIVDAALRDSVRNPESLRLRDLQGHDLSTGDRAICGEFDVTDDSGSYLGYTPFFLRLTETDLLDFELGSAALEACNEAAFG